MKSKETAEILNLLVRFVSCVWTMLEQLNSTHRMIDVSSFREMLKKVFKFFLEVISLSLSLCYLFFFSQDMAP